MTRRPRPWRERLEALLDVTAFEIVLLAFIILGIALPLWVLK